MAKLIENAQLLAKATRAAADEARAGTVLAGIAGSLGHRRQGARRAWIPA